MEKRFGKYTLVERLGGGGMAEVFRARLTGPAGFEKFLALKLILPHFSDEPEFVQMFIHEAKLAARLDHANIVRIHEFDRVDDRYYIAMELVDGADLRRLLALSRQIDRPLRPLEAVLIAREVCRGLAFAHGELTRDAPEIIHRDISPHNILLSQAGEVKLTDFGIAKLASSAGLTRTGMIKGKLAYMSPEQSRGAVLDGRSDLFALGCVLWEMLCGRALFAGKNEAVTLDRLRSAPIRPPSAHNPDVGRDLDEVVLQALARDAAARVASATEFGRRLDAILDGQAGLDRATLLVDLYGDLFAARRQRPGTAVMPVRSAAALDPGAEGLEAHHGPVGEVDPGAAPLHAVPLGEEVRPVGPNAPTEVGPGARSADPAPRPRLLLRWWMIALFFLPLLGAFAAVTVLTLSEEPPPKQDGAGLGAGTARPKDPEPDGDGADSADAGAIAAAGDPEPALEADVPQSDARPGPVRPARGLLNLNAIPWAKVYRRQRLLGETPLAGKSLPVGRHSLLLVNEELGVRRSVEVRIRPGETTSQVFDLTRAP